MAPTLRPTPPRNPRPDRLAVNLRELNLANNSRLIGRFPDDAASLTRLLRVRLDDTNLSCVPDAVALAQAVAARAGQLAQVYKCAPDALLPCFLEFESYDVPRQDDSRMACRCAARARGAQPAGGPAAWSAPCAHSPLKVVLPATKNLLGATGHGISQS